MKLQGIVIFKSKASGDVIMFAEVAMQMMQLMGKEVTAQGIVTAEQLPEAIAGLRAAVDADRAQHQALLQAEAETDADPDAAPDAKASPPAAAGPSGVSLTQRAIPLLELLERSQKKQVPVLWGV